MKRKRSDHSGLLITFEGGEGAGKTTLMNQLFSSLSDEGFNVIKTREPGGTDLGKEIRNLLLMKQKNTLSKKAELLLFLADRAQHVEEVLNSALDHKKIVLCDRFTDSTLAYQGAARKFDQKILQELCHFASNQLTPDLTLFLDLDPAIGLERVQKEERNQAGLDRIEQETLFFHQAVRKGFFTLAQENPKRFHCLDASMPAKVVFQKALEIVHKKLSVSSCCS